VPPDISPSDITIIENWFVGEFLYHGTRYRLWESPDLSTKRLTIHINGAWVLSPLTPSEESALLHAWESAHS